MSPSCHPATRRTEANGWGCDSLRAPRCFGGCHVRGVSSPGGSLTVVARPLLVPSHSLHFPLILSTLPRCHSSLAQKIPNLWGSSLYAFGFWDALSPHPHPNMLGRVGGNCLIHSECSQMLVTTKHSYHPHFTARETEARRDWPTDTTPFASLG